MEWRRLTKGGQTFDYAKLDAYGCSGCESVFHIEYCDECGVFHKVQSIVGFTKYVKRFEAIVNAGGSIKRVVCEKIDLGLR